MACQSKTLINDLGSAVVAEITNQLNTALSATPLSVLTQPTADAGTNAAGVFSTADTENISGVLFMAPEDCFVTNIKFGGLTTVALDNNAGAADPLNTLIVILRVPAAWTDGGAAAADQLYRSAGVHGNNGGVALGAAGDYEVVFATNGTALSAAAGFDGNQVGELVGLTATGGATGIVGADVGGTMVAQACANSASVSIPAAGFNMNAGDSLVWMFHNKLNAACVCVGSVGYRPVKDSLTLSPNYTQAMQNFSSTPR
jgi:hypothetical protein